MTYQSNEYFCALITIVVIGFYYRHLKYNNESRKIDHIVLSYFVQYNKYHWPGYCKKLVWSAGDWEY